MPQVPVAAQTGPGGSLLGGLAQLGRYLQLISIVPAAVVVLTLYGLMAGGAPTRRPQLETISARAADLDLTSAASLVVAIVALGMVLHPLQFALTQLLEGYWGPTALGRIAAFSRASIHLDRKRRLLQGKAVARKAVSAAHNRLKQSQHLTLDAYVVEERNRLAAALDYEAYSIAAARYPDSHRLRPTRLGNRLRWYEDLAGEPYGLNSLAIVPHLMWLSPADHVANVDGARADLDLAVRFVSCWLLLAVSTFFLLWPFGPWLLVPLASYGLAWVSYGAAVRSADEYGTALLVLVDLNHSLLVTHFKLIDDEHKYQSPLDRAQAISRTAQRA